MGKNLFYLSDSFFLGVETFIEKTQITLQMRIKSVNTIDFPKTCYFLKKNMPSVLKTECFNDENFPFEEEVKSTELGHLFEHILLDQICIEKIKQGDEDCSFSGNTSWNWKNEPKGVFHINIDAGEKEDVFFKKALNKTIDFMEKIISSNNQSRNLIVASVIREGNNKDDKFFSTDKTMLLPVDL